MRVASTGDRESKTKNSSQKWVVLAGLWLAYCCFGLIQGGIPPLIGPVSEELQLSRSAMGSVLGAWPLIYIATSIPAGALIDRFGLRRSVAVGIILLALSGLLRAFAVDYGTLFLAVAVFGAGGPFISIGAPKLISTWFDQHNRATAMGVYMTASGVGRILALATANSILMPLFAQSWRMTLATFAGFTLLAAIIWWVLAKGSDQMEDGDTRDKSLLDGMKVLPELLSIRVVQIILLLSLGTFLFSHAFSNWLPEILRSGGMTASAAGLWATLPVVIGMVATLIIPQLAIPRFRLGLLMGIFIIAGLAALVIGFSHGQWLTVGLILQGIASRGVMPVMLLILMDARQIDPRRMGAVGGLYFTVGEVGGVLGPLMLGVAADITGDFQSGIVLLAGLCFVLAVGCLTLRPILRSAGPVALHAD